MSKFLSQKIYRYQTQRHFSKKKKNLLKGVGGGDESTIQDFLFPLKSDLNFYISCVINFFYKYYKQFKELLIKHFHVSDLIKTSYKNEWVYSHYIL